MATKVLSVVLAIVVVVFVVMVVTAAEAPNLEGVFSHREEEGAMQTPTPALANIAIFSPKQDRWTSATPLKGVLRWRPCTALCMWLTLSWTARSFIDTRLLHRSLLTYKIDMRPPQTNTVMNKVNPLQIMTHLLNVKTIILVTLMPRLI